MCRSFPLAVPRSPLLPAAIVNLVATLAILPLPANVYDFAGVTGSANAYLAWGVSPWLHWNFGSAYMLLDLLANGAARVLHVAGLSEPIALHLAFKAPLLLCNLSSGFLLAALARRLRWPRPTALGVAWLLNPIPILVVGYWGQIEPVVICCFLAALLLALDRHWFLGGVAAGVGAGFEYVTLAFALIVAISLLARLVRPFSALLSMTGLALGLVVNFGPVWASPIGRAGLANGVVKLSTSGTPLPPKEGSLWALGRPFLPSMQSHWALIFAAFCVVLVATAAIRLRRHPATISAPVAVAIGAAGLAITAAVVLDPLVNPQFTALVLMGLLLVTGSSVALRLAVAVVTLIPFSAYFIYANFYSSFLDIDRNALSAGAHLLPVFPLLPTLSQQLSAVLPILVATASVLWLADTLHGARPFVPVLPRRWPPFGWPFEIAAVVAAVGVLLAVGVWSNQPSLWAAAAGEAKPYLFDTPYFTSRLVALQTNVNSSGIGATFSLADRLAAQSARVRPVAAIEYQPGYVVYSNAVGTATPASAERSIAIPKPGPDLRVDSLGLALLLYNRSWRLGQRPRIGLDCGPSHIYSAYSTVVIRGWAIADFFPRVTQCGLRSFRGPTDPTLRVRTVATNLDLNGAGTGHPWVRVWYASGTTWGTFGRSGQWLQFSGASPVGLGRVFLPLSVVEHSESVNIPSIAVLGRVEDVAMVWRNARAALDKLTGPAIAFGVGYFFLILFALFYLGSLLRRSGSGPSSSMSMVDSMHQSPAGRGSAHHDGVAT